MIDAETGKKQGRDKDYAYMAPAVKGMKKAHDAFFIVKRTGLNNRADQHFDQSAAYGIDRYGDEKARKGIRQDLRQDGKKEQSCGAEQMGGQNAGTVADPVDKPGRKKVHCQLDTEIKGDQKGDPGQGDAVALLKSYKQQRDEIVDDCLYHITGKAGIHSGTIRIFHRNTPAKRKFGFGKKAANI